MNDSRANKSEYTDNHELAIGVSSCLLGNPVRYDGSHKLDRYITEVLGKVFAFVPVCPEVETGLGVPRETIDLHSAPMSPRVIGNETGIDRTASINRWSSKRVRRQDIKQVCGFVLKSKSPTCGLNSARIIGPTGRTTQLGQGLFAMALSRQYPFMPIIEEHDLHDMDARDNFIVRLFASYRLRAALGHRPTVRKLTAFHEREICLLNAHSRDQRRRMDQLLSQTQLPRPSILRDEYFRQFMATLSLRSTVVKNVRVMNYVRRILKEHLFTSELTTITRSITTYSEGRCSLYKPLSLLKECAEKYRVQELLVHSWLFLDEREIFLRFNV